MVRRFTGGGTVIVDENTLFGTFIMNGEAVDCPPYPREIMAWSSTIYDPVFSNGKQNQPFGLSEHDYTLGDVKIGGNAQAIIKKRWCHHTSFLWSFERERMKYLLMPPEKKRPAYRRDRDHNSFLTKLQDHLESIDELEKRLSSALHANFEVEELDVQGGTAEDVALELGWDPSELNDGKTVRTRYVRIEDYLEKG